jgi:hypothetical protein
MKKNKLIAMAVLISALSTAAARAQVARWEIVSGPGAGASLQTDFGSIIIDALFEANGHVAEPDECDCVHYHGVLFGKNDPNPHGCGWGCIEEVPPNPIAALGDLLEAIDQVAALDPDLADKLLSILDTAASAASNNCNSLFLAAASALGDEMVDLFSNKPSVAAQYDSVIEGIVFYCNLALDSMNLPQAPTNEPPCCSVMLLRRHGSAAASKLFDAKRKINADVGEVVVLDAKSCPAGGPFMWEYKFKGVAKGDVPSGAGISFTTQRLCVLSEKPTTVTVTVSFICPNGREVHDTVTINIQ